MLTGGKISDKKYEHTLKVWDKFELRTMKNYHNMYLKCDVLLLLLLGDANETLAIIA